MSRRNTRAVRNPIAACPEVEREIRLLTERERQSLARILKSLSARWRIQAEKSWRTHKPPMAAYWKQNAVNARHLAVAIKSNGVQSTPRGRGER